MNMLVCRFCASLLSEGNHGLGHLQINQLVETQLEGRGQFEKFVWAREIAPLQPVRDQFAR